MKRFKVTEQAMRPALDAQCCFYCKQPIGQFHESSCVLIKRKVKVKMTIESETEMPAEWDEDMINFKLNESSWCATNALDELFAQYITDDSDCACPFSNFEALSLTNQVYLDE